MRRKRRHTAREERLLKSALDWAREQGFKGSSLPRGDKQNASECPLGLATGLIISTFVALRPNDGTFETVEVPRDVVTFIDLFDKNRYPELIRKEEHAQV